MTADAARVTAWVEELAKAHAAATPGPWTAEPNYRLEKGCRCLSCWEPIEGSWDINPIDGPDCPEHGCWHNVAISQADAAAIVAAHNALPKLIAVVRGVAELHQPIDDGGCNSGHCAEDGFAWPCPTARLLADAAPDTEKETGK